jgi:hypothetical protein
LPSEVNAQLAEYLDGSGDFDTEALVRALAAMVEIAADYGGAASLRLGPNGTPGNGNYEGFVADPRFASWLWVHQVTTSTAKDWRTAWIDRLRGIDSVLASLQPSP